ncbi:dihydropteroate synthase [Sulfurimonas paralvinellae]|uniref:dihydropteroate synthase n=1 Tax=Sulfurimonas paralvinellae TaxID=317658 RepID=A0A7M1B969_9BACT|nr:dihydropteroate synthase [Sulfurimonas paralvinellae]QOP46254.1 dihydropteroate synthase [Sulfurimonas paralvinellae]
MIVEKLSSEIDIKQYLKKLDVDNGGVSILSAKAKVHLIAIKDLHVGAANILKQDALSVGADLAVPRGTVVAKTQRVDCLLIATTKELEVLSRKELAQPFGLKDLAKQLKIYTQIQKPHTAKIMGVINANDDSFFSSSRFQSSDAIKKIEAMIEEGADIIDIGGVSSRPNAPVVSVEEELKRVRPVCDLIAEKKLYECVDFSIDSYEPAVIEYALQHGFRIVNDITGLQNDAVCEVVAKYKAQVVIMHMQGTPQMMQNDPYYEDVLDEVYSFFQTRIAKAESFGIEDIVLDVGIGFGKRLEDNLMLLKNLEHFLSLQKPILFGASRKSMIDKIFPSPVEKRLAGTLALHLEAFRNGASILRVHDVYEHAQALRVQETLLKL